MKIQINSEYKELHHHDSELKIAQLLQIVQAKPPFAVALNGEFVAQDDYLSTAVSENDKVDIVSPIFGG